MRLAENDSRTAWRWLAILLLILGQGFFPTPASACTAPPGGLPHYSVTEHVQASDVVVEGLVLKTEGEWYPATAVIQVYQYIKGRGAAIIAVSGYAPESMCGTDVRTEMHAIFYIRIDEYGSYYAMQLGQFDAVADPTPENIAEAILASGQAPMMIRQSTADAYMTVLARITPGTSTPSPTVPPTELIEPTLAPPTWVPDTPLPALPAITATPSPAPDLQADRIRTRCAWLIPAIGIGIAIFAFRRRSL